MGVHAKLHKVIFKRRVFKFFTRVVIVIKQVCNNFFITASRTAFHGGVIFSYSGGFSKLRGNKRRSYRSAELVLERYVIRKLYRLRYRELVIFFTMPRNAITSLIVKTIGSKFRVTALYERARIPHALGPKRKKSRRI